MQTVDPVTYSWSPTAGLSCTDCPNPIANPNVTTTYEVTATSVNGCVSTSSVTVEVTNQPAPIVTISPDVIISEKNFTRLNTWLRSEGFTVEEVPYAEIAKQEGLLRCSTMPLIRD